MSCKIIINAKDIKSIFVYIIIQLLSINSENCLSDVSSIYPCICSSIFYYYLLLVLKLTYVNCALYNLLNQSL